MHAIAPAPDMATSFVIGVGSGIDGLVSSIGRIRLPRLDRSLALDPSTAATRSRFAYHLDLAVREADRAVLLVGAGVACPAIAWWARLSPKHYTRRVAGALFFAPDEGGDAVRSAFLSPRERLGFPSIIMDDFTSRTDTATFAAGWGSEVLPYVMDDESSPTGSKPWHWLQRTVRNWTAAIVEHDVRLAVSLAGRPNDGSIPD